MLRTLERIDEDEQLRRDYIKLLDDLAKRFDNLDHATIKQLTGLLQNLRKDIAATLLNDPGAFETWRLTELKANIEAQVQRFESLLGGQLKQAFSDAANIGDDLLDAPLNLAGLIVGFNQVDPAVLNVINDFSAMLVKNIGDDLRGKIDTQLRLAALAQSSPFNVMKGITDAMGIKSYDGVWGLRNRPDVVKGVAARAETIVRTEMTRVLNLGHYSRQQQASKVVPGLLKAWQATGDKRTSPLQAHIDTHNKPIPIDKPFTVGGWEMMYPGDPRGPAAETVNCRCVTKSIIPAIGVIETPLDLLIRAEAGKRNG